MEIKVLMYNNIKLFHFIINKVSIIVMLFIRYSIIKDLFQPIKLKKKEKKNRTKILNF